MRNSALSILVLAFTAFVPVQNFERIMLDMESKVLSSGKVSTSRATIHYQRNGDMVTHTSHPKEAVIINNRKGSVSITLQ